MEGLMNDKMLTVGDIELSNSNRLYSVLGRHTLIHYAIIWALSSSP